MYSISGFVPAAQAWRTLTLLAGMSEGLKAARSVRCASSGMRGSCSSAHADARAARSSSSSRKMNLLSTESEAKLLEQLHDWMLQLEQDSAAARTADADAEQLTPTIEQRHPRSTLSYSWAILPWLAVC